MTQFLILGLLVVCGAYYTQACTYLGKDYAMGEKWKAADGCNECVCGIVGSICTKQLCTSTAQVKTTMTPMPCVVMGTDGSQMMYKDGESFKSPDGCNTCVCRNGNSLCTLMACLQKDQCTDSATGKTYSVGQSFPSADGCNTCQCFDGGISCTKMMCNTTPKQNVCMDSSGMVVKNGNSFKASDGCNTCTCQDGIAACTEMACMKLGQCFDKFTMGLYDNEEKFKAPDGCNTCFCKAGVISCTKIIC